MLSRLTSKPESVLGRTLAITLGIVIVALYFFIWPAVLYILWAISHYRVHKFWPLAVMLLLLLLGLQFLVTKSRRSSDWWLFHGIFLMETASICVVLFYSLAGLPFNAGLIVGVGGAVGVSAAGLEVEKRHMRFAAGPFIEAVGAGLAVVIVTVFIVIFPGPYNMLGYGILGAAVAMAVLGVFWRLPEHMTPVVGLAILGVAGTELANAVANVSGPPDEVRFLALIGFAVVIVHRERRFQRSQAPNTPPETI
jgi:hypothetical protein